MNIESLTCHLAREFGWTNANPVRRLEGGEWNDTWLLESDGVQLVVRIANRAATLHRLEESHRLMRVAGTFLPEVAPPLPSLTGDTVCEHSGRFVTVLPYISGTKAKRDEIDPGSAGAWLGRLHQVPVSGESCLPRDHFDVKQSYIDGLADASIDLSILRAEFANWLPRLTGQPTGLLHGDYYPSNIIIHGADIAGVVDWDESQVGVLAWELGRALWEFAGDVESATYNRDIAAAFLAGYACTGGPAVEKSLLFQCMACNRLWDALWAFQDMADQEENLRYHVAHLRAMSWILDL